MQNLMEELKLTEKQQKFVIIFLKKYIQFGWEDEFSTLEKAKKEIEALFKNFDELEEYYNI